MCWITLERPIKQVAEKDIEVFKVVYKASDNKTISYYQFFGYYKDTVNEIELRIRPFGEKTWMIDQGFHSYKSLDMIKVTNTDSGIDVCVRSIKDSGAIDYVSSIFKRRKLIIAKFIIPKGSEYLENQRGEIVSNKIMFKEEVND